MTTRSSTPDNSRSDVAAILLEMSQSPAKLLEIGRKVLDSPETIELLSSASTTQIPDSIGVVKVSNSDNEGMGVQAHTVHREPAANKDIARESLSDIPHVEDHRLEMPGRLVASNSTPWAVYARDVAGASRPHSVPVYRSPFTVDDIERTQISSLATGSPISHFPIGFRNFSQINSHALPCSQLPSLIPPDMVDYPLAPVSSFVESRVAHLPDHVFCYPLHIGQSQYDERSLYMSQPSSTAETKPPLSDLDTRRTQSAHQLPSQAGSIPTAYMSSTAPLRPVLKGKNAAGPALSETARVQRTVRISHAPRKPDVSPPRSNAAKRARYGFGPMDIDITNFKYRTIKAIRMPAQHHLLPLQDPPEPTRENLPYGKDIDYKTSMLIYWLDEKELSYTESARRFRAMFPGETTTDDTIRRKHHSALIKLARRHGLKPEDELEEPSKSVIRRGQQAGHRCNKIGGKVVYAADAGLDVAGSARPSRLGPAASRGFLKACICVWRDTSDVSLEQIQQRLANEYDWHIGANTVRKLYYSERGRVYDTHGDADNKSEDELDPEETSEAANVDYTDTRSADYNL